MSTLYYLAFNFLFYSFLGYLIEQIYARFTRGHFKSEGFLYGPFKPMYGFAMTFLIAMLYLFKASPIAMLVLCLVIPTAVEYVSGFLIKTFFHVLYWDYSLVKCNYQGLICLPFSLAWMGLCFIGIYYFQPFLNTFYMSFANWWGILFWPFLIYLAFDFFLTVRRLAV